MVESVDFAWLVDFDMQEEWHLVALSNIHVDIGQWDKLVHGKKKSTQDIVLDIIYFNPSILMWLISKSHTFHTNQITIPL